MSSVRRYRVVARKGVNVYATKVADGKPVALLKKGEIINVEEVEGTWLKFAKGWVMKDFMKNKQLEIALGMPTRKKKGSGGLSAAKVAELPPAELKKWLEANDIIQDGGKFVNANSQSIFTNVSKEKRDKFYSNFAAVVSGLRNLERFDCTGSMLKDDFLLKLIPVFTRSPKLRDLRLESNDFYTPGFLAVGKMIETHRTLIHLTLSDQRRALPTEACTLFVRSLEESTVLQKLTLDLREIQLRERRDKILYRNVDALRVDRENARGPRKAISAKAALKKYNDARGGKSFEMHGSNALRKIPRKKRGKEWPALAQAINNADFKKVVIQNSGCGDHLCKELCAALASTTTVLELSLDSNDIQDDGMLALAGLIEANSSIERIRAVNQKKQMASTTVERIVAACQRNTNLTKLALTLRMQQHQKAIDKVMKRNSEAKRRARVAAKRR